MTPEVTNSDGLLARTARPGLRALKKHLAPFILIEALGAALVIAYYRSESLRAAMEVVQDWKVRGGLLFVVVAGGFAGGVLPNLAKAVTGLVKKLDRAFWMEVFFAGFVYAIIGVEVDALYKLQATMFGTGIDIGTLAKKNAFDMLIFTPFASIPTVYACYDLRALRSVRAFWASWRTAGFAERVLSALFPAWAYWVPMLLCVYSLPSTLQYSFAQVAEGAWCLIMISVAQGSEAKPMLAAPEAETR
ncbi:MAG: hypothetical protein JSS72_09855 [Armatimonadetes bacterium]|nr:hypothetical protein [Armatimonadota bacterium]